MSYVLDALKKSESERQQNQAPHLLKVYTAEPSFRKSNGFNRNHLFLGLIILFSAVTGIGTYSYWSLPGKKVEDQTAIETSDTVKGSQIVINQELKTIETDLDEYLRANHTMINLAAEKKKIRRVDSSKPELPDVPIPLLRDLPAEIRNGLPELNISGHTFSANQDKRMIIINNKILREGSSINASTILKEITWEGVIIDFNGMLFRIEND